MALKRNCLKCGKLFTTYPSNNGKYCSHTCHISGSNNPRWNNGRTKANGGYIMVKAPEGHPYATKHGYIREHRLVMEQKLGRYLLPHEDIDHINSIKTDNRPENLQVISRSDHIKLEHKRGIYKEHLNKLNHKEHQYA